MKAASPAAVPHLLLVDDDKMFGRAMVRALSVHGCSVTWARSCAEAREVIEADGGLRLYYAIVDDRLGDGFGLELLPMLDALRPRPRTVLISAHLSAERAIAALRAKRVILPKPRTPSELIELLAVVEERVISVENHASSSTCGRGFGAFALNAQGLLTGTGFLPLPRASLAVLRFLLSRSDCFLSAAEVARDFLGRRDEAGQALVRRQIANLRRSLGPQAWIVESVPKLGYRIDPRALDPQGRGTA